MTDTMLESSVPAVGSLWLITAKQQGAASSFAMVTSKKEQGGDFIVSILVCVQPSEQDLATGEPLPFVDVVTKYWTALQDQYVLQVCSTHNAPLIRKLMYRWWHDYVGEVAEAFVVGQDLTGSNNILPLKLRSSSEE